MIYDIKKHIIEEGIVDHVKNNYGKYAGGAAAAGLAGTYAAGQGLLGVEAQDAVQDFAGVQSANLHNDAIANATTSKLQAAHEVFSRPDNIVSNWDNNEDTYNYQQTIQKENLLAHAENAAANGLDKLTSMDQEPDKTNFMVRHPITSAELAYDNIKAHVTPYTDYIKNKF